MDSAVSLAFEGQLAVVVQQNAKQRSIVNMQLGTMFAEVMGKISVAALRGAHRQYQQRLTDDGNCQGLYTSKICYQLAATNYIPNVPRLVDIHDGLSLLPCFSLSVRTTVCP